MLPTPVVLGIATAAWHGVSIDLRVHPRVWESLRHNGV